MPAAIFSSLRLTTSSSLSLIRVSTSILACSSSVLAGLTSVAAGAAVGLRDVHLTPVSAVASFCSSILSYLFTLVLVRACIASKSAITSFSVVGESLLTIIEVAIKPFLPVGSDNPPSRIVVSTKVNIFLSPITSCAKYFLVPFLYSASILLSGKNLGRFPYKEFSPLVAVPLTNTSPYSIGLSSTIVVDVWPNWSRTACLSASVNSLFLDAGWAEVDSIVWGVEGRVAASTATALTVNGIFLTIVLYTDDLNSIWLFSIWELEITSGTDTLKFSLVNLNPILCESFLAYSLSCFSIAAFTCSSMSSASLKLTGSAKVLP